MNITGLELRNFRNHAHTVLEFDIGINALIGDNGQGKTSVLEAISFLCLTRSFSAVNDETVVQIGKDSFEVKGTLTTESGIEHCVTVEYTINPPHKQITINRTQPETFASVIGMFPVVVLSPQNRSVTFGPPAERRRFMDMLLSQMSGVYFSDLLEYRRTLRHRNKILSDAKAGGGDVTGYLAPWTSTLVKYGSRIIQRRRQFVGEFRQYVSHSYNDLVQEKETPGIEYHGTIPDAVAAEDISSMMTVALEKRRDEELRRGMTLVGPHRDDLVLTLNGFSLHQYASQGQHKTFLTALKLAEFSYLRERREQVPVVLLDDMFSELDEHRSRRVLDLVSGLGQTFVTATDESVLHGAVNWNRNNRRFYVEQGTCRTL
jgi:DNA replication and repair protein RecF